MEARVEAGIGNLDHNLITIKIYVKHHLNTDSSLWLLNQADYDGLRSFYQRFHWDSHCFYTNQIDDAVFNFSKTVLHRIPKQPDIIKLHT